MQLALFCALIAFASLVQGILGCGCTVVTVPLAQSDVDNETVISSGAARGPALPRCLTAAKQYPFDLLLLVKSLSFLYNLPVNQPKDVTL